MNRKIRSLIKELTDECDKEKVSLICTANNQGETVSAICGGLVDLSFCLGVQEKKLSEKLPIHPEILRKSAVEALEEVKSDNHKHTFVIENAEDLQDILNRIASGEFDE